MALADTRTTATTGRQTPALFSPAIDFLCLGGASFLLLPALAWLLPSDFNPRALGVGLVMSSLITYPHFAHSYQIFYRSFGAVVRGQDGDPRLRLRYWWAGLVIPILLAAFLVGSIFWADARTLGYAGNAMAFFVGWHYVKQGFGALMVDAALRRSYFDAADRKVLLINAYVSWIVSWLVVNKVVAERNLWGISFAAIDLPSGLLWLGVMVLAVTTVFALWTLLRHARAHPGAVPLGGIAGYLAPLYLWVFLIRAPVLGAVIPALHGLQYLVIVWRYQLNVARSAAREAALRSFAGFLLRGVLLGWFGFWVLPGLLDHVVAYDAAEFGGYLFFFVLFVFINIHHYFIDNAMWRKENPHTLKHLFTHA